LIVGQAEACTTNRDTLPLPAEHEQRQGGRAGLATLPSAEPVNNQDFKERSPPCQTALNREHKAPLLILFTVFQRRAQEEVLEKTRGVDPICFVRGQEPTRHKGSRSKCGKSGTDAPHIIVGK